MVALTTPTHLTTPILLARQLLEEERAKSQRLTLQLAEAEALKGKLSELTRRCEDVSRAYEQEKRVRRGLGSKYMYVCWGKHWCMRLPWFSLLWLRLQAK